MTGQSSNRTLSGTQITAAVICELIPWLIAAGIAALFGLSTLVHSYVVDVYAVFGIAIVASFFLSWGTVLGGIGWFRIDEEGIGTFVMVARIAHAIALFFVFAWGIGDPEWVRKDFFDDLLMPAFVSFMVTPGLSALALVLFCRSRRAPAAELAVR